MSQTTTNTKIPMQTDVQFTYHAFGLNGARTNFWNDVGDTFGTFAPTEVTIMDTETDPLPNHDKEQMEAFTLTARFTILFESHNSERAVNEELHHFFGSNAEATCENAFQNGKFSAKEVSILRTREKHADSWTEFGGGKDFVIQASGEEIEVPDDVQVATDEQDVPRLNREEREEAGKRYKTGRPAAEWHRKENMHGAAWWACIRPNPGSADEDYDDFYESEAAAVRAAIGLAERYDVPLLIR